MKVATFLDESQRFAAMGEQTWRDRLRQAIEASGRSETEISEAAGLSHGYLHSMMARGQEPTLKSLLAVIDVIGASPIHIIHGVDITPNNERFLKLIRRLSDEQIDALLRLAEPFDRRRR